MNSVAIARFWDGIDDESYQFLWNEDRPKWLRKGQARLVFEAEEVFLAKTKNDDVIGMTWYSQCADDLQLDSGETISKEAVVEVAIAVHQDWRGCGFGKQLLELREQHLRENPAVTHMLSRVHQFNPKQIERLTRAPGWAYIGIEQQTNMKLFLCPLRRENEPLQSEVTAIHESEPHAAQAGSSVGMDVSSDSDSFLSSVSSTDFDLEASIASIMPEARPLQASGESSDDDDVPLMELRRRRLAAQEQAAIQPGETSEVGEADLSSELSSLDLDDDDSDISFVDALKAGPRRVGLRDDAATTRPEVFLVKLERQNRLPAKDASDLPYQQLKRLVEYNQYPGQSWTDACRSLAEKIGLSLNYINSALNLKSKSGVGEDAAKKINEFRAEKQAHTGQYVEGKRSDHPDLAPDVLFWPPGVHEVVSRKDWLRSQDWKESRVTARPTDDAALLKMRTKDFPRYQLHLLKKYNDAKDRPFSEMMGLNKMAVSDVLNGRRDIGPQMASVINAFKQGKESDNKLRTVEKKNYREPTDGIFFWPPEFNHLVSHAEWRASQAEGRGVSRDQLLAVERYNAPLSRKEVSVLLGLHQDRLSAMLKEKNPDTVTKRVTHIITGALETKREQGKLSREKRTPGMAKDILCWPPGFEAITPEKRIGAGKSAGAVKAAEDGGPGSSTRR